MTIDEALERLSRSRFRGSFKLTKKMKAYVAEKGMEVIRRHAADFIRTKLAPSHPANDGKQTPMHGHPVFIAQHATATCCRTCLNKWWRVQIGIELNEEQQKIIVNLIMAWIVKETEVR